MRARSASAALSETFEREPIETYMFLPSGEKTMSRVQWPPLRRRAAPAERCAPKSSAGPRAFRSPVAVGETNYAVGIRHVQKLGIVTRRIKRNPERLV